MQDKTLDPIERDEQAARQRYYDQLVSQVLEGDRLQQELKNDGSALNLYKAEVLAKATNSLSAMIEADPFDGVAIAKLQNDVRRYVEILAWIARTLNQAGEAEREIMTERSDDSIFDESEIHNPSQE